MPCSSFAIVDLAPEALARQQVAFGVLPARLAVHELPVGGSRHDGIQPTPLSTETSFRSGKRWQTPPKIRSTMQLRFWIKNIDDTRAKFARTPRRFGSWKRPDDVACADLEADRNAGRPGRGPERVPVPRRQRRLAPELRLRAGEHDGGRGRARARGTARRGRALGLRRRAGSGHAGAPCAARALLPKRPCPRCSRCSTARAAIGHREYCLGIRLGTEKRR